MTEITPAQDLGEINPLVAFGEEYSLRSIDDDDENEINQPVIQRSSEEITADSRTRLHHILDVKIKNCSSFWSRFRIVLALQMILISLVVFMFVAYYLICGDVQEEKWLYTQADWGDSYSVKYYSDRTIIKEDKPISLIVFKSHPDGCNSREMCQKYLQSRSWFYEHCNFMIGGDNKVYELAGWDEQMTNFENNHTLCITIATNKITDDILNVAKKLLKEGHNKKKMYENTPVTTLYSNRVKDAEVYKKLLGSIQKWDTFVYVYTKILPDCQLNYLKTFFYDCEFLAQATDIQRQLEYSYSPFICLRIQIQNTTGYSDSIISEVACG